MSEPRCAFCGSTSHHIDGDEMSGFRVACDWEECGASGPLGETRETALRFWMKWDWLDFARQRIEVLEAALRDIRDTDCNHFTTTNCVEAWPEKRDDWCTSCIARAALGDQP